MCPKCARFEGIPDHSGALQRTMTESTLDCTARVSADFHDFEFRTENPGVGGSIPSLLACSRVATRARKLREHLHEILTAAHSGRPARQLDLDAISTAIQAAHAAQVLVTTPSPALARHSWSLPVALETPLHACSLAVERLLIDKDRRRIRKCGASDCGVYYLDMSKGQRRQWCSMKGCGNREKQRRWRSG
jgi:predicted RNA-binding Zn ribbon-like protein